MDINGQDLIRACSAIGAGLAVIAGIGPDVNHAFRTGGFRDNRALCSRCCITFTFRSSARIVYYGLPQRITVRRYSQRKGE